ncbi:MAG: AMP-binding protein, partial [Bacteroidales bacterium]|nr:AMP-binding protein [Bacteroidales bacterium]
MEILRTFDLLENLKSYPPKDDILARRTQGKWIKYSIDQYIEIAHAVAYGLLALGYKPGTKVITITTNRPEWNFMDMGINLAHMVHVPVYSTLSHDDYVHIFNNSDVELIVVGTPSLYKKIAPIAAEIDRDIRLMMMDDSEEVMSLSKLYALGRENKERFAPVVEENKKSISPDECASIVYTSGTTGLPKGVMLSHRNMTFNSHGHAIRQTKNYSHRMVSFLPLCHMYERTMNYEYQELAISIYYAESLATIASDLKDCHADGFCAVPRVLELMYGKLEEAGKKLTGFKRKIYDAAWNYANNFDNGTPRPPR